MRSIVFAGFQAGSWREQLLRWQEFEPHAPATGFGLIAVTDDLEAAYLRRILHVRTDAEALIVITHMYHSHRVAGSLRQAPHVKPFASLLLGNQLSGDGQLAGNDLVHSLFKMLHLLLSGCLGKRIIQLTLLALDVRLNRPSTAKETDHGLVDDVLCRVHRRIFLLIVCVEFHLDVFYVMICILYIHIYPQPPHPS